MNSVRLPKEVVDNMIEFYRRQHVIGDGTFKKLGNLSFPSEMKRTIELGLAEPAFENTPRVLNWYSLNPKGIEVVESYEKAGLTPNSFDNFDISDHYLYRELSSLLFNVN